METIDELRAYAVIAAQDGAWGNLLNRGAAWSIMRRDGVLPPDAPRLGEALERVTRERIAAMLPRVDAALRRIGVAAPRLAVA